MYVVMVAPECAQRPRPAGSGRSVRAEPGTRDPGPCGRDHPAEVRLHALRATSGALQPGVRRPRVPWYGGRPCRSGSASSHGRKCFFIEPHAPRISSTAAVSTAIATIPSGSRSSARRRSSSCSRQQAAGCDPLSRLADRAGPGAAVRDVPARDGRTSVSATPSTTSAIRGSAARRCSGHRAVPARVLLRLRPAARRLQPQRHQPDEGRDRLLRLRHDGLAPTCQGGAAHRRGMGLGQTLDVHQGKFGGILNGVDYDVWNPEIDRLIPIHYARQARDKYANKQALRDRFWLRRTAARSSPTSAGWTAKGHASDPSRAVLRAAQGVSSCSRRAPIPASTTTSGTSSSYLNDNPDCHLELGFSERAGASDLCRRRHTGGAEHVRAVRSGADDRASGTARCRWCARSAAWSTPCSTATTPHAPSSATGMSSTTPTTGHRVGPEPGAGAVVCPAAATSSHSPPAACAATTRGPGPARTTWTSTGRSRPGEPGGDRPDCTRRRCSAPCPR